MAIYGWCNLLYNCIYNILQQFLKGETEDIYQIKRSNLNVILWCYFPVNIGFLHVPLNRLYKQIHVQAMSADCGWGMPLSDGMPLYSLEGHEDLITHKTICSENGKCLFFLLLFRLVCIFSIRMSCTLAPIRAWCLCIAAFFFNMVYFYRHYWR